MLNVLEGLTLPEQQLTHVQKLIVRWFRLQNRNDRYSVFIAVEICEILLEKRSFVELEAFLSTLPEDNIYIKNEQIVRAKIFVAFEKKNFQLVFYLIENNEFENGEDLIDIWDNAHYAEEIERTKKPLTSLSRFRVRERHLPPKSICPERERRKSTLGQTSRHILRQWFEENRSNPYPSKETKEYLSKKANLTPTQVKTWFSNTRRRLAHVEGQGAEQKRLPWQKYKKKKTKESKKACSSLSTERDRDSNQDSKITKQLSGQEDSSILVHNKNGESAADITVSISTDSEVISTRQSPDNPLYILPGNPEEKRNTSSHEKSTCQQDTTSLSDIPSFELVQPPVVVNPSLSRPTELKYFCDNYSYLPINLPCTSIGSVNTPSVNFLASSLKCDENPRNIADTCAWQLIPVLPVLSVPHQQNPLNNTDVKSNISEKTSPLGLCLIPFASPGQLMRFHAASALLDLSLQPSMPGMYK